MYVRRTWVQQVPMLRFPGAKENRLFVVLVVAVVIALVIKAQRLGVIVTDGLRIIRNGLVVGWWVGGVAAELAWGKVEMNVRGRSTGACRVSVVVMSSVKLKL